MAWLCGCKNIDTTDVHSMQYQVDKANAEAETRLKNAQKYYRVKNFLEAALEARAGLHAGPEDGALVPPALRAQLGYTLATALMFDGDLKEAVEEAEKVREISDKEHTVDVLNGLTLAETLSRLGQKKEAMEVGEATLKRIKQHNHELANKASESGDHRATSSKGVGAHADSVLEPTTRITEEVCAYLHIIVAEGYMKNKEYLTASKILRDGLAREEKIEEDTRAKLYMLLAQSLHLTDADPSYFGY